MFKKIKRYIAVLLAMTVIPCNNAFGAYRELDVPIYQQEKSNWCWVASGKMAGNFLCPHVSVSQSQLVFNIKGSDVNETGSIWEAARAMEMSTHPTKTASVMSTGYFSWIDTKTSIYNGYPLLARVADSLLSSNGHFYVIKAYDPTTGYIKVIDPLHGQELECGWGAFLSGNWIETRPYQNTVYFDDWNS